MKDPKPEEPIAVKPDTQPVPLTRTQRASACNTAVQEALDKYGCRMMPKRVVEPVGLDGLKEMASLYIVCELIE